MPAGRPTKLTEEAIDQAIYYINGGYEVLGHAIPSVVGMSIALNITRSALYRWAEEEGSAFKDILEDCNTRQHEILISKGLQSDFNPTICKLVLGKHGYHERQEVTGADGKPIQLENKLLEVSGVKSDGN